MKKIILLFYVLGVIGCGGKKRPWGEVPKPGSTKKITEETGIDQTSMNPDATTEEIETAATPIILYSDIQTLFDKHCMICHRTGESKINWVDYTTAKSYVDNGKLYERIWTLKEDQLKSMPLGNVFQMTIEERKQIVQWIEAGGPQ